MAFTRKALKAMGIEDEKIDQIMDLHTEVVDAIKTERDSLKESAAKAVELQTELDEIKSKGNNDEGFKSKYEAEHKAFDDFKKQVEVEKKNNLISNLYTELLKGSGVSDKYISLILKATDLSKLDVDENGKLKDVESLKKTIKEEYSDFIPQKGEKGAQVDNPPADGGQMTKEAFDALSLSDKMKYANEHPTEATAFMKQ